MSSKLSWGILGTGAIARCFADGMAESDTSILTGVASRSSQSANQFAREFGLRRLYVGYDTILQDDSIDAVYISLPHPMHARWALRALEAGKHVLCEKPMAMSCGEVMRMAEAAVAHQRCLMEAFRFRCHPQTRRWVDLLREGAIGELQWIEGVFSFNVDYHPASRLWDPELGGGAIMDVGCYPLCGARLAASVTEGAAVTTREISGRAVMSPDGVDSRAGATVKFASGPIALLRTGIQARPETALTLTGSKGKMEIPDPWIRSRNGPSQGRIVLTTDERQEEIFAPSDKGSFAHQTDAFARATLSGKMEAPEMPLEDSVSQAEMLERWRYEAKIFHPTESWRRIEPTTFSGKPLRVVNSRIPKLKVDKLNTPVSRLVMGCDNQFVRKQMEAVADTFFEYGGNTFDTAYHYGGGIQERLLGRWVRARGVRDEVVVVGKGAHTPECDPPSVTRHLEVSLDRLKMERIDVYFLHRDNPDIPAGEFIDVLNRHVEAGQIGIFGGSNWTPERIDEANEYAVRNGLQGFTAMSNNFSLARMEDPIWPGCVAASDSESKAWLERTQTALFAWSSQARGFFVPGRAAPEKTEDEELSRCWYSERNFRRLERARELAKAKDVDTIQIALAYVLAQPFPTFALIGPRRLSELRSSLPGLDVELSPEDLTFLEAE